MPTSFTRTDFDASIAEAAIAGYHANLNPETLWLGGHTPLIDVRCGDLAIDVKTAFIHMIRDAHGTKVESLGFMGSGRDPQVRPGVTDYGLVVLTGSTEVVTDRDRVTTSSEYKADRYLFPASVIDQMFRPGYRMDHELGSGLNLYIPLAVAAEFRLHDEDIPPVSALLVNFTRFWDRAASAAQNLHALEGDWPVHGPREVQAMLGLVGALLVGSAQGVVRGVRRISGVIPNADNTRFRFETDPTDELPGLIGQRTPDCVRFIPGQQWPVKFANVSSFELA